LAKIKNHHAYPVKGTPHWFATVRRGGNSIYIINFFIFFSTFVFYFILLFYFIFYYFIFYFYPQLKIMPLQLEKKLVEE